MPSRVLSRRGRVRTGLLIAVVAAATVLAGLVVSDPYRYVGFPGDPGRTVVPGEVGWVRGPDAPVALTEVAAAAHAGRIWVAGGMDARGQAVAQVFVFDPGSEDWTGGPDLPEPVHHAALVSDGDTLFLIGGFAGAGATRPTDAVWSLTAGADRWRPDRPLPQARAAGAAAWDGRGRIVYGGGVGLDGVSDDVFAQDGDGWRHLARLSEPREHLAATSAGGGSVTFLGGRRGGLDGNLGAVDLVSGEGIVGRTEDVPTPRGGVAAFSAETLGDCLVGGEGPVGTYGDVECIGVTTVTVLPGLGVPRHGLGAVVVGAAAYALLGGPQPGLTVSAVVERLDLASYQ